MNYYKKIKVRQQNEDIAKEISSYYKIHKVAGKVLSARGFQNNDDLKKYIQPSLKEGLPDPRNIKNIGAACAIVERAKANKDKVAILSDFDVDGLSGAAQVSDYLNKIGIETRVLVPDRFIDGYGLNERLINDAHKNGCRSLIAIDFGTSNNKELSYAKDLGLTTIVIDHHFTGDIVSVADAFINPSQVGCGFADGSLCASALCWYFIVALQQHLLAKDLANKIDVKNYLDLACLGTICDMVPLVGVNRIIAKRGLELLSQTSRIGIQALKSVSGINKTVNCHDVSFGLGPRLNAAGRIIHGELVVELLTTNDSDKASKLAKRLNSLNTERQELESTIREKVIKTVDTGQSLPPAIIAWDKSFHTGVIGIVAQRMVEAFYRPSAILGSDEDGILKGSVRGIKNFNVVESLASVKEYLIKYGGHSGAGGFSVSEKNVNDFAKAYKEECEKRLKQIDCTPYAEADAEITLADFDINLVNDLRKFAPFGVGNSNPLMVSRNLKILDIKVLKETHIKGTFTDGKRYVTGVAWRQKGHPLLQKGKTVNIAFRPEISNFNGSTELIANIQAVDEPIG